MKQDLLTQKKQAFKDLYPDTFFLDVSEPDLLTQFLRQHKIIGPEDQVVRAEKAGEGNMNLTIRVVTQQQSLIVKQSRPWVEKYPDIPAPVHRTSIEGLFYKTIAGVEGLSENIPAFMGLDEKSNVIFMEDLGQLKGFDGLYQGTLLQEGHLQTLLQWLHALHQQEFSPDVRHLLKNCEMRQLNHEHIFSLPLRRNNGLDLESVSPGLSKVGDELKNNPAYLKKAEELGKLYLSEGSCLLHGDYYPGSWMRKDDKVYVIDPEFCFFGPPEFDLSVVLAHLVLASQPPSLPEKVFDFYQSADSLDKKLVYNFAGIEIMRRLLGVARLPVPDELGKKEEMLMTSLEWVLL